MDDTSQSRVIADTVARLPRSAAQRFPDHLAARYKRGDDWHDMTYAEIVGAIEEVALGFVDLGVNPGDRVCVLSDTRLEWTLASYGITVAGGIVVPIYPTNSPSECRWVISDSGAVAVICENAAQRAKISQIRDELPSLAHVITIDRDRDDAADRDGDGAGELTLDAVRDRGRRQDRSALAARQDAIGPGDPYTIIYTSGTTGPPKGVVLTHRNAMSVCEMVEQIDIVQPGELTYLYLPLAHAFALTSQLASYDQGTAIIYYGGDTKRIVEEIAQTHPTYVPSVPRIFEKIYTLAMNLQAQASEEDQERFRQAIKLGVEVRQRQQRGESVPAELQEPFQAAEEQIFTRVRGLFGGQIHEAISGAAPIAPEILEFFYACGVPVLEGWGMTETTAVGTVGTLEAFKFGTVGRPMPGVEMRVADDGELLIKGPNVFTEYWRNPQATSETLVDGWLHTGDLGEIDDEGFVKITGRKKDIIITAGGKNLTPANLENDLKQSRFISQAVMYGDRRPYPVALVTLDPEEIVPWAREQGLPDDLAQLARHERVHEIVQRELDRANANYAQVEQVKRFQVLDHDLSIETGELTPTLKVKRNVIYERYAEVFERLYSGRE